MPVYLRKYQLTAQIKLIKSTIEGLVLKRKKLRYNSPALTKKPRQEIFFGNGKKITL